MAVQEIDWLDGRTDDLTEAFAIRSAVFCDEQGYRPEQEFDDIDREAWHVLVREKGEPVGTGRLFWQGADTMVLGRIAVRLPARSRGIGACIVGAMLDKAAALGAARARLDAQCRAIGFYEKLGFTLCGTEHMDGHVPHRPMVCELPKPAGTDV